jgi:hypothetical protein
VWAAGAAMELVNCSLVDSTNWGLYVSSGTVTARNCIAWGNGSGGVSNATTVAYTLSQETQTGTGNLVADPLFVDTTYYHLQSRNGHYAGGAFDGGVWERSSTSSPCIDAGDPTSAYSREPQPNGRRVNMGCYGNTPVASLNPAPLGTLFSIR